MTQGHQAGPVLTVEGEPIQIREYDAAGDRAFVASTWVRTCCRSRMRSRAAIVVDAILDRPDTVIRVACSLRVPSTILGYAVASDDGTLHYAYVPADLRRKGIARACITAALDGYPERIEATHRWPWPGRFVFAPEKLRRAA